nr:hypothetical protein [Tanacetum cinerariifolium]
MSVSMEACIARHATLLSPPLLVPSLPLPFPSPLTTSPTNTGAPLGYRAAGIRMRALLPSTSRRTDIPKADMPPRKRACLTTPALEFEVGESFAAGSIVDKLMEIAPTTLDGVNERVTELDTTVRQRTDEFELRFKEAQDDRALLRARAWAFSMDKSSAIAAHVKTLETQLTTALGRIEILEAKDLEPQEGPVEAGSSSECDADRSRNSNNNNDSGTGGRRQMTTPRECTYTDFLKCQPMSFYGSEGVVGLTRWIEKMELVFQISNCIVACQVKFTSCTLQGSALTWWNSHMRAVGQDVAYAMPWAALKRMITSKYCPWGRKVHRCLPDMIHGNVKASKPQSMQEVIEFAIELMDKKMLTHAECQAEQKRKLDDTSRNNQHQQKIGHWARDCKGRHAAANNNNNNNQRAQGANARGITCFECGVYGHYKNDCPNLKNGNQGNRAGNRNAVARAYAVRTAGTNPNSNVVT